MPLVKKVAGAKADKDTRQLRLMNKDGEGGIGTLDDARDESYELDCVLVGATIGQGPPPWKSWLRAKAKDRVLSPAQRTLKRLRARAVRQVAANEVDEARSDAVAHALRFMCNRTCCYACVRVVNATHTLWSICPGCTAAILPYSEGSPAPEDVLPALPAPVGAGGGGGGGGGGIALGANRGGVDESSSDDAASSGMSRSARENELFGGMLRQADELCTPPLPSARTRAL